MLLLSDCVLAIDGERIALSTPLPSSARPDRKAVVFGIAAVDATRLTRLIGHSGVVHTKSGVVLMRLRVVEVDSALNVLTADPVRADEANQR